MVRREADPLDVIPTSKAVHRWLAAAEERVRRLRILLITSRRLEARDTDVDSSRIAERGEVPLV
jgi:hypothetical protein